MNQRGSPAKPLICARALSQLLSEPTAGPTLLDVRWELGTGSAPQEYRAGHIPTAVFVDLDAALAGPPGAAGRHPLPDAQQFAGAMRAAGVSTGQLVVVYDAASGTAASRAWWLLRYFGHQDAAVLDGGIAAWIDVGGALERGQVLPSAGDFEARAGAMPLLDAARAAEVAAEGLLLDARAPERFRGEHEPIDPVAGHIPGAINRPTTLNVERTGRFLTPGRLRAEFEQLGIRDGIEIGAYCGSGVTAAHEVLALELAGYRAALYAGSWSEWISDPSRPVARSG